MSFFVIVAYVTKEGWGPQMISNVVNEGRLLSLQASEWLMLIAGGVAGSLILMF